MGDGIGDVAKSWLADPPWQKVFKHTFDVIEDYVNYILVAVGGIALSVRLLTTLSTGDLVCIVVGVDAENSSPGTLDPYPSGSAMGFINYASTDPACIASVFTKFMEYLPYIMLVQTLILVVVEKFTFKIPRIAQKVERFYQNIVEQSLFGKDPDVAEDMYDPKTSTEAISRRRQRNEICVTLKRSSIIHDVYIGKNCIEVLLVFLFLFIDVNYYFDEQPEDHARCKLPVNAFPGGPTDSTGHVIFQCHGKKMNFFIMMLIAQIILLGIHGICSTGSILWCLFFRSVTRLLQTIESMKRERGTLVCVLEPRDGKDFLFLFDLLAHTCGLESTLRVLTHSDETFYEICRPNFDLRGHLTLEEDKIKIVWIPADIERWLQTGKRSSSTQRAIEIDSYEVTIFPAESVKNTHTLPALSKQKGTWSSKLGDEPTYHTWFYDLHGGRTEYVITIACMIGKSRMKGEKVVTNLVPYGPEKPRAGMVKMASTDQVEIFWDPPKGEFTKYYLDIDLLSDKDVPKPESVLRLNSVMTSRSNVSIHDPDPAVAAASTRPQKRVMENLSSKLTTYTILGLEPGESYQIELGTKTGNVVTRQAIKDIILTRPEKPKNVRVTDMSTNSCLLAWVLPSGHSCLKGFQIHVKGADGKTFKDLAVSKNVKSFPIQGLSPGCDYDIAFIALCQAEDGKRTESEPSTLSIITLPEKVRNLRLDNSAPTSLTIKWDAPVVSTSHKYKVSISGSTPALEDDEQDSEWVASTTEIAGSTFNLADQTRHKISEYASTIEVPGDKTQYTFSKLPEIVGTGHAYTVDVIVVAASSREGEVASLPASGIFVTRPLAPTNFRLDKDRPRGITWYKSMTPHVRKYRVRWKPSEDSAALDVSQKTEDAYVSIPSVVDPSDPYLSFAFPPTLAVGAVYKVNVYAIVETANQMVESKELHEKILVKGPNELVVYIEEQKEQKEQ